MIARVGSIETSKIFYTAALALLGYQFASHYRGRWKAPASASRPRTDFWIYQDALRTMTAHVPFSVSKRVSVDAFYAAAMAAGSRDNGKPSLRTQYCANYYGAFVLDPDGYIEAVCRESE